MSSVRAVISDFGGVLTTPMAEGLQRFSEHSAITLQELGTAMAAAGAIRGENPLFALETGRLSESDFLAELSEELTRARGDEVSLEGFGEVLFAGLAPNERFLAFMRTLRGRGHAMAICTNNVREWSARWQAILALGVEPESAVFIDDLGINCEAATALGMRAVWFRHTEQAIADVEAALNGDR
jgi:putative hydrolase of the HAD superfamily